MGCREAELRKVLALSEKEEADRKKEEDERIRRIDEQNSKALFDDSLQMYVPPPFDLPLCLPIPRSPKYPFPLVPHLSCFSLSSSFLCSPV
jgi:hypothetical protein